MSTLGIVLMVVGAALVVAEAHVPSHGALGTGAAAAFAVGVALVVSGAGASGAAVLAAAVAAALVGMSLAWVVVIKSLATRRLAVRSGAPALVGRIGTVRAVPEPVGQVMVDGALWRARMWGLEGEAPPAPGSSVVVERVDGLTLTVRPAEEWEVV